MRANMTAALSTYQALTGLGLVGLWFVGLQDVATGGLFSTLHTPGFGLHPGSFVFFSAAFLLAFIRRGLPGTTRVPGDLERIGSKTLTFLLGVIVVARGIEFFGGFSVPVVAFVFGDTASPSYSSFATLALLWVLHVCDAHWPRAQAGPMVFLNYAVLFAVLTVCLHHASDFLGSRLTHPEVVPGMSLLSAGLLVGLAAFILPDIPASRLLFDRRTPTTNTISAISLTIAAGILFLLENYLEKNGLSLGLSLTILLITPLLLKPLRRFEVDARQARGELSDDAFEPDMHSPSERPLRPAGDMPTGALELLVYLATFEAPNWQRLLIQGFWTFVLAYGAIFLSRLGDHNIAIVWWANGYLAYCLLLHPREQWGKPLSVFFAAVVAANLFAGNDVLVSSILTLVNAAEGSAIALAFSIILGLRLDGRRVSLPELKLSHVMFITLVLVVIIALFGLIGGGFITNYFGGTLGMNAFLWASGDVIGAFAVGIFSIGKALELHWGYPRLKANACERPVWLAAYTCLGAALFAIVPWTNALATPHILFILLCLPLAFMCSLIPAGMVLFVFTTAYFNFGQARFPTLDVPIAYPFVTFLMSFIIVISFVARVLFQSARDAETRTLDFISISLLTLDDAARVMSISKNAETWFDSTEDHIIGRRLSSLFDLDEATAAEIAAARDLAPGEEAIIQVTRRKQNGARLVLEATIRRAHDIRLPYEYIVSLRDISREAALRAEKEALIDRSPSRILVQDTDLNTLQCSDEWVAFTGYSREETLAKDFHEFLHPDDRARAEADRNALPLIESAGDIERAAYRLVTKSGEIKIIRCRAVQQIEDGELRYLLTIFDITELQTALQTTQAYLTAGTGLFRIQDEDFNILSVSEKAAELFGLRGGVQDHPQKPPNLLKSTDAELAAQRAEISALATGEIWKTPEPERVQAPDGRVLYIERTCRWFENPTGTGRLLYTEGRDVTELELKKQELEHALRASEAYLNASTDIVTVQDEDFRIIRVTEELLKRVGPSANLDRPFENYPDWTEEYLAAHRAEMTALPTGVVWRSPDIDRLVLPSGEELFVRRTRRWFDNPTGSGRLLWTAFDDVTALVREKSFNEELLDHSPAIILTEGRDYKLLSCSQAWVERLGYTREETVGADMTSFIVPEQVAQFAEVREGYLDGTYTDETWKPTFVTKDGQKMYCRMNVRVDRSSGDWRVIHTVFDVTELEEQRQYIETLLNKNASMILTQDADWKILSCSDAWSDQLGYDREETVGRDLTEFMHPDDAAISRTYRDSVLKRTYHEKAPKNTLRFITKHGEERVIELQSVVKRIGGLWRNIVTLADITELMHIQSQLRQAEARAVADRALAIEASRDGIAITDETGAISYINQAYKEMFAIAADTDLVGENWRALFSAETAAYLQDIPMSEVARSGSWSGEIIGQSAKGLPVEQEIGLSLQPDGGVFWISRDIRQRRRETAERERLRDQLRIAEKRQIVGQMAAGLAHDFNNVLASISGNSQLIQGDVPEKSLAHTGAERIQVATDRAGQLVKRLLSLGRHEVQPVRMDLRGPLKEAADIARNAVNRRHKLTVTLPEAPVNAVADATEVLQMVLNLLLNASDAIGDADGEISVSLDQVGVENPTGPFAIGRPEKGGRYFRISVRDTGCGMSPELAERAFKPYETTKGAQGSGLGLAIVSSVVTQANGALRLETAPARGTTFEIFWPERPPAIEDDTLPSNLTGRLDGHTILLVDDNEDLLRIMTAYLEAAGAEVASTSEPADAMEAIADDPEGWDLIITDFEMPGFTGLDVAKTARTYRPDLPIILVTALAGVFEHHQDVFDTVVLKPADKDRLIRTVEAALRGA